MFELKNPEFFDVFVDCLADLTIDGPTEEIAIAALRLQSLLKTYRSDIVNNPTV